MRHKRFFLRHLSQLLIILGLFSPLYGHDTLINLSLERAHHKASFAVEIAQSPHELEQGLMHRRNLAKDSGMLFVFPQPQVVRFWMKDTWLALDLVFIDENFHVVQCHKNAKPHSLDLIISDFPIKYVLELSAGSLQNHHIHIGDRLIFQGQNF